MSELILTGSPSEASSRPGDEEEAEDRRMASTAPVRRSSGSAQGGPRGSIFCLVCGMASMGPEGSMFIQPCRCGYWVHDQCLINVALQFEDYNPDTRSIGCKVCRRAYNILPVKGLLLRVATKHTNVWYQNCCYLATELFLELVVDIMFLKLGKLVFILIYGSAEAAREISSMSPLAAIFTCQLIPAVSLAISNVHWECNCLDLLRNCSSLPVIGGVFPLSFREVDIFKPRSSLTVVGGLLLPFYAVAVGKLFVYFVKNPFHRFLLGGVTVILVKGVCKMYYKQKKYVRFCTFTVEDYITAP